MLIWSLHAHESTIWVSIQIAFSILNLLKQENRHLTNMFYSVYLVLLREVYSSPKKYHSPLIREHTFYRHGFLLSTVGPPEQIANSAGYMETYSELISVCSRRYFFYFVFSQWIYTYQYWFSKTGLLNIVTLILK